MKLKFRGTEEFVSYHGDTGDWHDGDEKNVSEPIARELLSSFPENFAIGKENDEKEKSMKPKYDKALRSEKDK